MRGSKPARFSYTGELARCFSSKSFHGATSKPANLYLLGGNKSALKLVVV
jgi:hypothetical protein